jgi:hypothetical protein
MNKVSSKRIRFAHEWTTSMNSVLFYKVNDFKRKSMDFSDGVKHPVCKIYVKTIC